MEDWKFYTVILGVTAALVGIYFREALKQAHIQKNASSRLLAYLNYWNQNILDWDIFSIVYVGEQWRKDKIEAYSKSQNIEDINAVNEEYENKLKNLLTKKWISFSKPKKFTNKILLKVRLISLTRKPLL